MNLIEKYETSPFWALIDLKVDSIDENRGRVKLKVRKDLLNGNYILHGGVVTALLDAAMGLNLKLNQLDKKFATISLTSQFMKAVKEGEILYASAEIVQSGKSIAYMEASLTNEKGDLISKGLGTFKFISTRLRS